VEFSKAKEIAAKMAEMYVTDEVDAVYAIYNEFKNVMVQRLCVEKLLPIDPAVLKEGTTEKGERSDVVHDPASESLPMKPSPDGAVNLVDYIYEQSLEELFRSLLPKYVVMQVFRGLQESVAAEHAARMTAMDAATNNATDMIDSLTLAMNRARQAKITKEIIEIVSGAAAQ